MRKRWAWLAAGTLAGLGLAGGWGFASPTPVPEEMEESEEEGEGLLDLLEVLAHDLLPPGQALAKAAGKAGSAVPVEVELTTGRNGEDRVAAWEIVYLDGDSLLEVLVDAHTGAVLGSEKEEDPDEVRNFRALLDRGGKVGLSAALDTLAGTVEGLVLGACLDDEAEVSVWEAMLVHRGRAAEFLVSTATGKFVLDDGEDDDGDMDDDDDGDDAMDRGGEDEDGDDGDDDDDGGEDDDD